MNGRLVGELRKEPSGGIEFHYDRSWLGWENAISVSSSMPLREERFAGAVPAAFFENLLPDDRAIRVAVAARTNAESPDTFDLLAALGRDCIGALQFLPAGADPGAVGVVQGRTVTEAEIAALLQDLARVPLGAGSDPEFRISLAGAQEKTALLRHQGQWLIPHGTTATTHILKPAIGPRRDGLDLSRSVENEWLCLRLVSAFGLPVAAAEMATFEAQQVLIVERFDRRWMPDGRLLRLPQEDLCQALGVTVSKKYEADGGPGILALLAHLRASDDPTGDRRRLLQAQVLFWALGATDGHAKNFSQFLRPGGRFLLAPLYDIMSAQPNVDAGQIQQNRYKLAMAVGTSRHYVVGRITRRHFIETMMGAGLSARDATDLLDDLVVRAPAALDQALGGLPAGFPQDLADAIARGVRARFGLRPGH
ncbi:type II toxin-antitoxin system HipA family toxin [Paracraurococcus lichenis]|uniref:Type II toxin-antitoxin system HipA family toxin n=1 Tax=Paracraurococcus lichenis TaxID=3064888 RepID=A0ABT9EAG0_9PROT|nr:type II toxin-antitoxin system HipA family toxin [Paracraurococcus sp. LOR1-02]MDO9713084.1 type II toxin-antitoxin system HipA family toxin [Paracraurococcus sp. LOR1-02]